MNSVHDMGGMHGFGPVVPEQDEPVFHAEWERRTLAVTIAMGAWGRWNIDASRFQREQMPPPSYLSASYYQIWMHALVANTLRHGFVSPEELARGHADSAVEKAAPPMTREQVGAMLGRGSPSHRESPRPPAFAIGDTVRTRNIQPRTHTRLPRYTRDKPGTIVALHGTHVFPDTNALFQGENPQPLYTVRFRARDLWGDQANPRDTVCVDLWEDYLVPA